MNSGLGVRGSAFESLLPVRVLRVVLPKQILPVIVPNDSGFGIWDLGFGS